MIKRFPSRNQRSKSIKVKHVLQICLLVGVCFWLAYQVKRSHDKKREFEESDANSLVKTQIGDHIPKLGRKDLNPRIGGITKNHKNEDEEEDELVVEDEENKHEEEREEENEHEEREGKSDKESKHEGKDLGEEEDKHEVEDQVEEENSETEDEGKGGGDEDIDASEKENSETEMERDEEFVDEENEKEEIDVRENEKEGDDKERLVENHNTREAREENYKADDASSAVAHNTQTTVKESGKMEHSGEGEDVSILGKDTEQNSTENGTPDNSATNTNGQMAATGSSLKETTGVESGNTTMPNSMKDAVSKVTHPTTEMGNNATDSDAQSNGTTEVTQTASATQTNIDSSGSSLQNEAEKLSESDFVHNANVNGTVTKAASVVLPLQNLSQVNNSVSGESHSNANPVTTGKAENFVAAGGNSSSLETRTENVTRSEGTEEADKSSKTSDAQGDGSATQEESKGNDHSSNTDEATFSSKTVTADAAELDPIDTSDSLIQQEVAQVRNDVDTLPDVTTSTGNSDETAAE